jgi:hypothetical protein
LFSQTAQRVKASSTLFNLIVSTFRGLQRISLNVTPNHFYWPIPDLREHEQRDWPVYLGLGCDLRPDEQLIFCQNVISKYCDECDFGDEPSSDGADHFNNGFFETVDAEVSYSMLRYHKPLRVIEIGSGYSTRILAKAIRANYEEDGVEGKLITIDPHQERLPLNGMGNFVTYVPKRVQDMDLDVFDTLKSGDVLFIDSSHVVGISIPPFKCFGLQAMQFFHASVFEHYFPRWKNRLSIYASIPTSFYSQYR